MLKRVFFDMDGTVARFYSEAGCVENFAQPGFFSRLEPYRNMIRLIQLLCAHVGEIAVYGLSVAPNEVAATEKRMWLSKQLLGSADPRLIVLPTGTNKAVYVKTLFEVDKLSETDVLIDDFSAHLVEWTANGGTGIKALNEINGRGWNGTCFQGLALDVTDDVEYLYASVCQILGVRPKTFSLEKPKE